MLTAVKQEFKIALLSVKYNIMREMINPFTFITNVLFMILNNASFIIQWLIFYSLRDTIGGYSFKEVMLLWAIAATTYGFSHLFCNNAYNLSSLITEGKLDSYIVQPKNILLNVITKATAVSAIGDLIYGLIVALVVGLTIPGFLLFIFFSITGAIITTGIAIIFGSLSFFIVRGDLFADNANSMVVNFSTYPEGIFNNTIKFIFYTILPIGYIVYLPVKLITQFNLGIFAGVVGVTIIVTCLSFLIFNIGLKRYSSSNLMSARI